MPILILAFTFARSLFKSQHQLMLENLALRQQVTMLRQSVKRPRATVADRMFWILFSRYVDDWRKVLHSLHSDTVVLSHDRRQVVHFNVTEHPTAQWTAQQLVEAFPFDSAPRYLLRDRDAIYGEQVQRRIRSLGIDQVITAPRSPWQNAFAERFVRSIKDEGLERVILFGEASLRRALREYVAHYHTERNHQGVENRLLKPLATVSTINQPIQRRERLGGILNYYYREAA